MGAAFPCAVAHHKALFLSCRANKSSGRSRDGQRGGKNERQSALPDLAKIAATKVNR